MVGFQTKLAWLEQRRIFRMIPGLENAEFVRYGSVHRNTFLNAPTLLTANLQLRSLPRLSLPDRSPAWRGMWNPRPWACWPV